MRRAPLIAAVIFGLWCAAFCWHGPGIEYDEADSINGVTVLLSGSHVCAPTAIRIGNRCWPLMVASYVGAFKDYLAAPFFLLFGMRVAVARLTAGFLGMLCIWGFGSFLRDQVSPFLGACTAFALSINPALLDQVLFDNGNIAMSIGLVGVAAALANRFLLSGRFVWAFAFGGALGLAVWSRLNFTWLLASLALGALFAFRRKAIPQPRALLFIAGGFLLGVAPLLLYYARDFGALGQYMHGNATYRDFAGFLLFLRYRLGMFAEIFFSDVEHRGIWTSRPELPRIVAASGILALAAVIWCLFRQSSPWIRCFAFASLLLTVILLTTQMPVAEHHLVILLPFVLACVVAFLVNIRALAALSAVVYGVSAIALNMSAVSAVHRNRGIGEWSDAIGSVYRSLDRDPAKSTARILDWGLEANLLFLSKAALAPAEIFWHATPEASGRNLTWPQEVSQGGLFLTTGPSGRHFPLATEAFQKALHELHPNYTVQQFIAKDGSPYALLYRVEPNSAPPINSERNSIHNP